MILYSIVKFFTKIVFRLYYRKIYVHGLENIPKNKPVLICSNHPNGFIEPLMIGRFMKDSIFFLVRGDLFQKPLLGWFLRNSQQIPIFRQRDGFKNLKSNKSTMDWINTALKEHKKILIFPEGGTEAVKHLRPLQKGVARMAFDFQEAYPEEDLQILPISINFTYPFKTRSEVMMSVSPPIAIKEYIAAYTEHKPKAYRKLLTDLKDALGSKIINLEATKDLELYEKLVPLFRMYRRKFSFSSILYTDEVVQREMKLADRIIHATSIEQSDWNAAINDINNKRTMLGLGSFYNDLKPNSWIAHVLLIIGFIPSLIGSLFHVIPVYLPFKLANIHAKGSVFWSSLVVSVSIATYVIYYLVCFLLAYLMLGIYGLFIILLFILLGWFFLVYRDFSKLYFDRSKWKGTLAVELDIAIVELKKKISNGSKSLYSV